jgi:succinate dehydrogenase / fumarate reductase, cytochrome b subunit
VFYLGINRVKLIILFFFILPAKPILPILLLFYYLVLYDKKFFLSNLAILFILFNTNLDSCYSALMSNRYAAKIPRAFFWRRLHSSTGLWLVGFLIIHLLTNSQAALPIGSYGSGFVKSANDIRQLPYIVVVEIILIAIPFLIHIIWGIQYLRTGQFNSVSTDGSKPSLPEYSRNHGYTWQRLTSWILLFLVAIHVIQMRFLENPIEVEKDGKQFYIVRIKTDPGLSPLADRFGANLYKSEKEAGEWLTTLEKNPLKKNEVVVAAPSFGIAELLMVRETFKIPQMLILYTVLVISACFHAFNGLWTFMITWGVTLTPHSQKRMRTISNLLMAITAFLGLAAVWGTYFINYNQ